MKPETRIAADARRGEEWIEDLSNRIRRNAEAVIGIKDFALQVIGARRVEVRCDPANVKSANVAERAGFTLEAELRDEMTNPDGSVRNTLVYVAFP